MLKSINALIYEQLKGEQREGLEGIFKNIGQLGIKQTRKNDEYLRKFGTEEKGFKLDSFPGLFKSKSPLSVKYIYHI